MSELFPGVGAGSLLNSQLLADNRSTRIGAIYRLDYTEAIVLTGIRSADSPNRSIAAICVKLNCGPR